MKFQLKKLNSDAIIPQRADNESAGFDLFSTEDVNISPGKRQLIGTGISLAIAPGLYGHISDRSGMAWKKGAHCLGKIIDSNFRGEIKIVLLNTDPYKPLEIKKGDRCAQIIFHKYYTPEFELVDELDDTERGEKGFGASGN